MARNSTGSKARASGAERVITAGARPPRVDMGRASTRVDARAMRWTPRSRLVATTLAVTLAACAVRVAAKPLSPDVLVVGEVAEARVRAARAEMDRTDPVDLFDATDAPTVAREPGDARAASHATQHHDEHPHHHVLDDARDHRRHHHHHHHHPHLSPRFDVESFGRRRLYAMAMGASFGVSCASLVAVCLIPLVLPSSSDAGASARVPSRRVVRALSAFAVGALLGDAFLHQLPHAYAAAASSDAREVYDGREPVSAFASTIRAQRVGLAAMAGSLAFYLVERLVRAHGATGVFDHAHDVAVAAKGKGRVARGRSSSRRRRDETDEDHAEAPEDAPSVPARRRVSSRSRGARAAASARSPSPTPRRRRRGREAAHETSADPRGSETETSDTWRDDVLGIFRVVGVGRSDAARDVGPRANSARAGGVLNLIADGAHNFTDGVAIGAAFVAGGPVAGWSKTALALAHELPQEIGDYGMLLSAGYGPWIAVCLNFVSALAALLGTAAALALGDGGFRVGIDAGAAAVDGFVAGGFVYLALGSAAAELQRASEEPGHGRWDDVTQVSAMVAGGMAVAAAHAYGGCGDH